MKNQIQKLKTKLTGRGSILVYTLIIMMIMLATALSIFAVAVREKKSAGTTAASMQAFAVADSGSEVALNAIFKNPGSSIGEIYSCTDGIATIPDLVGGSVQLTFYSDEESANIIPCNGPELLGDARKVKSVGRYGGTARAVEVAVAQTGSCSWFAVGKDCGGSYCLIEQSVNSALSITSFNSTSNAVCNIKNPGSWAAGWYSNTDGGGKYWEGNSWSTPFSCAPIGCLSYVYCCQ